MDHVSLSVDLWGLIIIYIVNTGAVWTGCRVKRYTQTSWDLPMFILNVDICANNFPLVIFSHKCQFHRQSLRKRTQGMQQKWWLTAHLKPIFKLKWWNDSISSRLSLRWSSTEDFSENLGDGQQSQLLKQVEHHTTNWIYFNKSIIWKSVFKKNIWERPSLWEVKIGRVLPLKTPADAIASTSQEGHLWLIIFKCI